MIKYLLRGCKFPYGKPSGKPDGMMVRADGWWTDSKAAVKLFDSEQEAEDFYTNFCLPLWAANKTSNNPVFIVTTEVKFIADKVSKTATKAL